MNEISRDAVLIRKRAKRRPSVACALSGRAPWSARLAQIAFGFAQARLSRRKKRLLGMTIEGDI